MPSSLYTAVRFKSSGRKARRKQEREDKKDKKRRDKNGQKNQTPILPEVGFLDAQEQAREHPATFYAPDQETLANLKKKDFVKVCYIAERFWVQITKIQNDTITGRVANMLLFAPFKLGETITFQKTNVYDVNNN